jgi:hypothetical protein
VPFILLLVGAVIAIAAFNNTQGDLATELEQDVPPFLKWGLALFGVGALGWIPGMQLISRWLLALVMVVLVLMNYQRIIQGFQQLGGATGASSGTANPTPATAYEQNPAAPQITQAEISGTTGQNAQTMTSQNLGNINAAGIAPAAASPFGALDPAAFLTAFEAGYGGFGGIA